MKKKILFFLLMAVVTCALFVLSVGAATTNEFGEVEINNNIDLSKMSTDASARVVLFDGTEYHTYPANYIIKSSSDLGVDFSKINSATGKSYKVNSIIRIEIPTTVKKFTTAINGNQGAKSMVEVSFPEGTQVTELVWGALMNCTSLEKIEIPATVVSLGQDAFSNCAALTSVTFAENSSLKSIGKSCFGSCKLLTEVVVPNSVETIIESAFYNCVGLKKLVLGANTTVSGGSLIGAYGYGDKNAYIEFYMNGAFATGEGSLASGNFLGRGNGGDLGKYVIFFTGTREQAIALVNKYSADVNFKDVNIVAYDPAKTSGQDYLGMEAYTSDITVNTNRVLVYDYNVCEAFYGGHTMSGETVVVAKRFYETIQIGDACLVCGIGQPVYYIDPIFTWKGYSVSTYGETRSITQSFAINHSAIDEYKKYVPDFDFGILATVNNVGAEYAPSLDSEDVIIASFDKQANDYIDVKITGIPSDRSDALIVFCLYVIDGEDIYYLDGGITSKTVTGVSYSDFA